MQVERTILIDAEPKHIAQFVKDFRHLGQLGHRGCVQNRKQPFNTDPEGQSYSWEGDIVGAGNMKVLTVTEDSDGTKITIDMELNLHPHLNRRTEPVFPY